MIVGAIQGQAPLGPSPHSTMSLMQARLPIEILQKLGAYMDPRVKWNFAHTARFTRAIMIDAINQLNEEIRQLPQGPLTFAWMQRLFVSVLTSPFVVWPAMDELMRRLIDEDLLKSHTFIVEMIKDSAQFISPRQMNRFCNYLRISQLSGEPPWIGHKILQQYLLDPRWHSEAVGTTMRQYLTCAAKDIRLLVYLFPIGEDHYLRYYKVEIDSSMWFDLQMAREAEQNGQTPSISKPILEVLWAHIQSLRNTHSATLCSPCIVEISNARLPFNFALELARLVTNESMFFEHHASIDVTLLEHPAFALPVTIEDCAMRYPNAVYSYL